MVDGEILEKKSSKNFLRRIMGSNKFTYVGGNFELYDFTTSGLRSPDLLPYTKPGECFNIFFFSDLSKSV